MIYLLTGIIVIEAIAIRSLWRELRECYEETEGLLKRLQEMNARLSERLK